MKTKLISTLKKELLIIEAKNESIAWAMIFNEWGSKEVLKWTILGKPDEIKEEDVKDLIERVFINYKDYSGKNRAFGSPINSFNSALESEIYWVNPFEKPNGEDYYYEERHGFDGVENLWDGGSYNEDLGQFEEAESRTFDKKRTLIFVKN